MFFLRKFCLGLAIAVFVALVDNNFVDLYLERYFAPQYLYAAQIIDRLDNDIGTCVILSDKNLRKLFLKNFSAINFEEPAMVCRQPGITLDGRSQLDFSILLENKQGDIKSEVSFLKIKSSILFDESKFLAFFKIIISLIIFIISSIVDYFFLEKSRN